MPLKKYYLKYLFIFLLSELLFQACNSTSRVQTTTTVVAHENKPAEKISNKTSSINEAKKEEEILENHNQNISTSALFSKYAKLLEVNPNKLTNEKLYKFIDEWWHVPYKYAGNSKTGIDCSGFSTLVLKTVYNKEIIRVSAEMYKATERLKEEYLQEGDLVFFQIKKGRISHVGVYLTNNKFVHASVKSGVTINSLDDPYYRKVFSSGGRVSDK